MMRRNRPATQVRSQPNRVTDTRATNTRSRTTRQPDAPNDGPDEEQFDLDVSGSEGDEPVQPAPSRRRAQNITAVAGATEVEQHINDPTPVQDSKKAAADTRYFFERQGDSNVCKVCK
jgi:hypothetical protein